MKGRITQFTIILFLISFIAGCGTDVKPSAIIQILKDESEIDEISTCVSDEPEITDEQIILQLNKQCIIDYSNKDRTETEINPTLPQIVANPERYMDKLLTFEAVIKKVHQHQYVELYTNDSDKRFYVYTHGASLYRLDSEGEQVAIEPNQKYVLKVRVYHMEKNINHSSHWSINAEFIVSTEKKIIYLPVIVSE